MHTHIHDFLADIRLQSDGVPIYVQIREQFLAAIASGALAPSSQLPTMRQVAVALSVDLNTVRHAYDELQRRGAIVLVRGRGSFVATLPSPAAVGPQLSLAPAAVGPQLSLAPAAAGPQLFLDCAERACPIDAEPLDQMARQTITMAREAGFDPADLADRILRLIKGT
jgi:GntR family transcriptional regulator